MTAYIPKAKRGDWQTPPEVIDVVKDAFGGDICLDPCASPDRRDHFAYHNLCTAIDGVDGLIADWSDYRHWAPAGVFVNPPFDQNKQWVERCAYWGKHVPVILLIPARVDTRYWHQHVATADAVCFWRGRIKFVGAEASAPFPVAFVFWGAPEMRGRFIDAFAPHGLVYLGPEGVYGNRD